MAQALWTTVRELRMAGVGPENLKAEYSRVARQACRARSRCSRLTSVFLEHQQPRRHGYGVRRGTEASGLVPDSA